jgi:hypothetical protein
MIEVIALVVLGSLLAIFAAIYHFQIVTRRLLRPFKRALKSGQLNSDERMTFQALIDQSNFHRSLFWCGIILTCFTGWGILLVLYWMIRNSTWKTAWRIDTAYSPVQYARTFGPQVKAALTAYNSVPRDNQGKYEPEERHAARYLKEVQARANANSIDDELHGFAK